MDNGQLWQLHLQGRDRELMDRTAELAPETVDDRELCELLGELFAEAGEYGKGAAWYRRANTPAAEQALPPLLIRMGDLAGARESLENAQDRGIEWQEADYLLLLAEGADPLRRMEKLEELLEEQYIEAYMTEYAALCILNGEESKGRRMLRRQLTVFSGGVCEDMARRLTEEGEPAAEEVLEELGLQRRQPHTGERRGGGVGDEIKPEAPVGAQTVVEVETKDPESTVELPEEVARCFEGIVGMETAKRALTDFYVSVQFQTARAGYELKTQRHHHFLLRGDKGTGKSLLSQRICWALCELGAASESAPCVLEGHRLGEILGSDGGGLEQALDACEGRNVVVDDISSLFEETGGDRSYPALFRKTLEKYSDKVNFLLLGTKKDIDHLLTVEPTLSGWFLYDIELPAYSPEELVEIAAIIAKDKGYTLSSGARTALLEQLESEYRSPIFQAGKTIESIIGRASLRLAGRVTSSGMTSKGRLMRIEAEDLDDMSGTLQLDQLMAQLDALTGLSDVKEEVRKLTALARVNQEGKRMGKPSAGFGTLHMVFKGNAGTGKTTVARIIGGIYRALGILPQGDKLVECGRSDLVAEYVGQTAPKVKEKIREAMGGVLFIDEAYDLCRDNDSFGQEAVDTLVPEVENHRMDLMVILAGYSEDMDKFLTRNSGLASRFPNQIEFPDYSQEEMEEIFRGMLTASDRQLDRGCEELLRVYIEENRVRHDFGNARGVRNLRDKLIASQALRLDRQMAGGERLKPEDFTLITAGDFDGLVENHSGKKTLEDWLAQLNALTGLAGVKEQVRRKVNTVLGQQKMKETGAIKTFDPGTMHMVFKGNAGTGKTTVARIMAGIYNTLGLLPDGDTFVECSRSDLVAEYVGQTAPKVKSVIQRAMGGVLFIDEAYSLCRDAGDSFGREAVDALIADMENHRRELMVILAGYTEDMERFFSFNQGMASRVPTSMVFEDYSPDELFQIFQNIIKGRSFTLSEEALEPARLLIEERSKAPGFGNARGVRNMAERIIEQHTAAIGERVARGEALEEKDYLTIRAEELQALE